MKRIESDSFKIDKMVKIERIIKDCLILDTGQFKYFLRLLLSCISVFDSINKMMVFHVRF